MNTLTLITDWVMATSFRASLLVLVVLAIHHFAHRHLSPHWRYRLWLPVLLVLITPVFLESRWSLESLLPSRLPAVEKVAEEGTHPLITTAGSEVILAPTEIPKPILVEPLVSVTEEHSTITWPTLLRATWAIGFISLLSGGLLSYLKTLQKFRRQRQTDSKDWSHEVSRIASEVGLKNSPPILISKAIPSPAVTGILRPLLLLPTHFGKGLSEQETNLILKHELMHLKRGDLITNFLLCLLMALHWFNPLLLVAFFKSRTDREAACDAQVLNQESVSTRHIYGHALLKIESAFSSSSLSLGFVGIFQKGAALRTRVRNIAENKTAHPVVATLASAFIMAMTFLGMTQAQTPNKPASDFHLGQAVFRTGDFIRITSVSRDGGELTVTGDYELVTHDHALLLMSVTQTQKNPGRLPVDPRQQLEIQRGRGSFKLVQPSPPEGLPHITFYSQPKGTQDESKPFGAIYFGTQKEAEATINLQLGYLLEGWKLQNFVTGQAAFRLGDSIQIKSIDRTVDVITVSGEYSLASEDSATLALYITGDVKNPPFTASQHMTVKKGRGTFTLSHPKPYPGMPHLTFYRDGKAGENNAFGALYFGHLNEAKASRKLNLSYMLGAPTGKSARMLLDEKMNRIHMPNSLTVGLSLPEAVDYIQTESQKLDLQEPDPAKRGVKIHLDSESSVRMTFMLKDMSLIEAIRYITSVSGTRYWIDDEGIHIVDVNPVNNPIKEKLQSLVIPHIQFNEATLGQAIEFLRSKSQISDINGHEDAKKGINFVIKNQAGSGASLTLDLKNVPMIEALHYITELSNTQYRIEGDSVVVEPTIKNQVVETKPKAPTLAPKQGQAAERARSIILPQVQFAGATVEEAVEFFRSALMHREDAGTQPINIIVKPHAETEAQLSLDLKDVPLFTAMRYVAELSNSTLSSDDHALIIEPK